MFLLSCLHLQVAYLLYFVFFFQAEDGIRDLVRSRGLGDVYKRQDAKRSAHPTRSVAGGDKLPVRVVGPHLAGEGPDAVSYTHLTLPTSDLG